MRCVKIQGLYEIQIYQDVILDPVFEKLTEHTGQCCAA